MAKYDNEFKREMIYLQGVISAKEMKLRVFDYIEGFYNRERLHSANGNMSPLKYEKNMKKVVHHIDIRPDIYN